MASMPRPRNATRRGPASSRTTRTVRLRPANPFDLIRLIAESQNDPRKAIAELVQNSLDAGGREVTITRASRKKEMVLSIFDDGRGVFPDAERPEALERIATNVGHSFKRNLSAAERQKQMMLGKYGIGLLGFWSAGEELEMRTRVAGSDVWALRLKRGEPIAEVLRVPERMIRFAGETWTEIVIRGVHPGAARQIAGRRLGDYLGSELRGQLLEKPVKLRIVDRVARGTAPKDFLVVPQRYRGRRLDGLVQFPVAGHAPARVEIFIIDPEEARDAPPTVALTCGGAVVCDDVSRLESQDFARPPWSSGALEGAIDFPDLEVAPATRRGIVPGPAADAFFEALRSIEPEVLRVLADEKERRLSEEDENLAREIRKVFRPVARNLPQYDFFEISGRTLSGERELGEEGAHLGKRGGGGEGAESETSEVVDAGDVPDAEPEIFPPGSLASVRIVPRRTRLLPGATRVVTAKAVDAAGRRILEGIEFSWTLREGAGTLSADGEKATFSAPAETGVMTIGVEARGRGGAAEAEAVIEVVEKLAGDKPDAGIPDPERIVDPAGDWRSRVAGRRWQYNAAHPDYKAVVDEPRRRLRYLVHLFAKEIVLWNYGEPKDERLLERMVEVLTYVQA
jgi:histidine kinase/DNA gyrase B/HSP90-like ATPase